MTLHMIRPSQREELTTVVTKRQLLRDPNSPLNKASMDEPLFLLRAKDPLTFRVVRHWILHACRTGAHQALQIGRADYVSEKIVQWRKQQGLSGGEL